MPLVRTSKGWKWGRKGKVYRAKGAALRQGRAIEASKARNSKYRGWLR